MEELPLIPSPINLSNFDVDSKYAKLTSPRSLVVVRRLGFEPRDLYPVPSKALFVKGFDSQETLQIKVENFEEKRKEKVEMAKNEYENCKEFTKYAPFEAYKLQKIKRHWEPASGDPSGKTTKTEKAMKTGTGDSTAIRMMAEVAKNQASQMMDMENQKMEAIKRRQKREIERVIENEGNMAILQGKILKTEEDEARKKLELDKLVAESRRESIKKKQSIDLDKKRELDVEILERNRIAAKEMDFERKLADREKKVEVERRKMAREKEIYSAQLMIEREAKTTKIFTDLEYAAECSRIRIQERNDRIQQQFEERKRLKEIDIRENRQRAEKRIQRAKDETKQKQVQKKIDYDKRVDDHAIMKAQKIEERREGVEAAAKRLADKHKGQKAKYKDAMQINEDFRTKTVRHAIERDGYYDQIQTELNKVKAKQATYNEIRMKEVQDNVTRIKNIQSSIQVQRQLALEADDERTDTIRDAKKNLVQERKQIAHDAGMRKWRVKECMEKMKISNKFGNLEKELNKAMGANGNGNTNITMKKTVSEAEL